MKRIQYISAVLLGLFMILIIPIEAQSRRVHNTRNRNNKQCSGDHQHGDKHIRQHHNGRRASSQCYTYHNEQHQHHKRSTRCASKKVHYRNNKQYNKHHAKHHVKGDYNHYDRHNKHHAKRYLRQLPTRHYVQVQIRDNTYFYCNGDFYLYQPGCGYQLADVRVHRVDGVPHHCTVRWVNGRKYLYKQGYYYIPNANGHYRLCNASVSRL